MRQMISKLGFGLLGLASTCGLASRALAYPTVWEIVNQSEMTVSLSCVGRASGLDGPIGDLRSLRVASGSRAQFDWSGTWYNDGLGLNAASWSCRDGVSGASLGGFTSDWGEQVTLILDEVGRQLQLRKSP